MESLDYTGQVLALQKRRLWIIILLLAALIFMSVLAIFITGRLKKTTREKKELSDVLNETVEAINPAPESTEIKLKPREIEILGLIAKGYTNAQVAESVNLSPETIKWYKKKFFAVFNASNSAELIRIVTERKVL